MGRRGVAPGAVGAIGLFATIVGCGPGEVDNVVVSLKGQVVDAEDQVAVEGAFVTLYAENGSWLGEGETDGDGIYKITVAMPYDDVDGVEVTGTVVGSFVDTELRQRFFVREPGAAELSLEPSHRIDPEVIFLGTVLTAPNTTRTGTIRGRIFDALEGEMAFGMGAVPLLLREGVNPPEGAPIVASTVTSGTGPLEDPNTGNFVFEDLPAGTYTVFVDGSAVVDDTWRDSSFQVVVIGGEDRGAQNGGMSKALEKTQARVTLTWSNEPANLDLHVTGDMPLDPTATADEAADRFNVYPEVPVYPQDAGPDTAEVFMDVDDEDGYGPETVTIQTIADGLYRFSAHDYINKAEEGASVLSFSSAQMQVWFGDGGYLTFTVPVNQAGTVWKAIELDGATGHYFPLHEMTAESEPGNEGGF